MAIRSSRNRWTRVPGALLLVLVLSAPLAVLALPPAVRAQAPPPLRTLMVRLAIDSRIPPGARDEQLLRRIVDQVSDIYERVFQIRWQVADVVSWTPASPLSLKAGDHGALRPDTLPPRGAADVVVVVSAETCAAKEATGVAEPFGALVIVKPLCIRGNRQAAMVQVLSHEFAHLFGAFHVVRRPSVMRDGPPDAFDDQTARIIRLMRDRDFRRGVDGIDDAQRSAFVAIFAESHQPRDDNPLVAALTRAGATWLAAGRPGEASTRFREAIRLDPTFAGGHRGLGIALTRENRLPEAIQSLREAVRLDPRSAPSHAYLGMALREQGNLDEAIAELREALAIEKREAALHYQMALTLLRAGRSAEAQTHTEQGRALNPDVPPELTEALRARDTAPARN